MVHPEDEDIVYVNNYSGGNIKTTDGGQTWKGASSGYSGANVWALALDPLHVNVVYAHSGAGLFRSEDGGANWRGITNYIKDFEGAGATKIYINPHNTDQIWIGLDEPPCMLLSEDEGLTWSVQFIIQEKIGYMVGDFAISESDKNIMYVAMDNRYHASVDYEGRSCHGVYKSSDSGLNWYPVNNGLEGTKKEIKSIAIHPIDPDIVYAGTRKEGMYKTTNGGQGWLSLEEGLPNDISIQSIAIDPNFPETIYAGVENGGVYKSTDGGNTWKFSILGMYNNSDIKSIIIDPSNTDIVYAADLRSGVYQSLDKGEMWQLINDGIDFKAVQNLAISSDGDVLYTGTMGGGVYRMALEEYRPTLTSFYPDTSDIVKIIKGNSQIFTVYAYDMNCKELQYSWFLDDQELDEETKNSHTILGTDNLLGFHDLYVTIQDSAYMIEVSWIVEIIENPTNVTENPNNIPNVFFLGQNYPNPFNDMTTIKFGVKEACNVKLRVFNVIG